MPRLTLRGIAALLANRRAELISILAQGLTFLAMILPIAFQLADPLARVVLITSVSTIIAQFGSAAAAQRIPSTPDEKMSAAVTTSLMFLAIVLCASVFLILLLSQFYRASPGGLTLAGQVAVICLPQGVYIIGIAALVQCGNYLRIGRVRLVYGSVSLVSVLAACLWLPTAWGLVGSASLGFMATVVVMSIGPNPVIRISLKKISFRYLLSNIRYIVSTSLAAATYQLPGLVVPFLGGFAGGWAVLTRLGSGFQTVGATVLGPKVDIAIGRGVRDSARRDVFLGIRTAGLLAILLSASSIVTMTMALAWTGQSFSAVTVLAILFWLSQIGFSLIGRSLGILGAGRQVVAFEIGRFVLSCGIFFAFTRVGLVGFALLGPAGLVALGVYVLVVVGNSRGIPR